MTGRGKTNETKIMKKFFRHKPTRRTPTILLRVPYLLPSTSKLKRKTSTRQVFWSRNVVTKDKKFYYIVILYFSMCKFPYFEASLIKNRYPVYFDFNISFYVDQFWYSVIFHKSDKNDFLYFTYHEGFVTPNFRKAPFLTKSVSYKHLPENLLPLVRCSSVL